MGPGTHLAKIDIKSAFRLLPFHVADRHLLGMRWKGAVFMDTCLPFGLRSAPKLFNILADLLAWIIEQHGVQPLLRCLDDFLTIGPHTRTHANRTWILSNKFVISWESHWHSKKWRDQPHVYHSWVLLWIPKPWQQGYPQRSLKD